MFTSYVSEVNSKMTPENLEHVSCVVTSNSQPSNSHGWPHGLMLPRVELVRWLRSSSVHGPQRLEESQLLWPDADSLSGWLQTISKI